MYVLSDSQDAFVVSWTIAYTCPNRPNNVHSSEVGRVPQCPSLDPPLFTLSQESQNAITSRQGTALISYSTEHSRLPAYQMSYDYIGEPPLLSVSMMSLTKGNHVIKESSGPRRHFATILLLQFSRWSVSPVSLVGRPTYQNNATTAGNSFMFPAEIYI